MIRKTNERFVCTTMTYGDLKVRAGANDPLAGELLAHFRGPVEMLFLTAQGRLVSKLTVVDDLTEIHPDTDIRPGQTNNPDPGHNVRVFLKHVEAHFGAGP